MGSARTRTVSSAEPQPQRLVDTGHRFPQLLLTLLPEHAGAWRVLLFSFTVFLFSPELLFVGKQ